MFRISFNTFGLSKPNNFLKGTKSVISSDPPRKESNVRFTRVPSKPQSVYSKHVVFPTRKFNFPFYRETFKDIKHLK